VVGGGVVVVDDAVVDVDVALEADVVVDVGGLASVSGDEHGNVVVVGEVGWLGRDTVGAHPKFENRVWRVRALPSANRVVEVTSRMKPAASTPIVSLVPE